MRPRPDWLRVVEGGAGSPNPEEPHSARPSPRPPLRRSGAHRCATPLPLPDRILDVEEHASFRWNASPWVKWLPAVLACSVLSGAMLWNLGLLWLKRADSPVFASRPARMYVTPNGKPATKAPSAIKQAARRPATQSRPDTGTPDTATPDTLNTLDLLAAASLLAAVPPTMPTPPTPVTPVTVAGPAAAPQPDGAHAAHPLTRTPDKHTALDSRPAPGPRPEPAVRSAPDVRRERIIQVVPVRDDALDAEMVDLANRFESLPADVKREILDSVRLEIRAWSRDARHAAVPPAIPSGGVVPPGIRVADESPLADSSEDPHHLILLDGSLVRINLPRLAAPATPKG